MQPSQNSSLESRYRPEMKCMFRIPSLLFCIEKKIVMFSSNKIALHVAVECVDIHVQY